MRTPSAASSSSSRWRGPRALYDKRTAPSFLCRDRREHLRARLACATARGATMATIARACAPSSSTAWTAGGALGPGHAPSLANACRAAQNHEGNPASRHRRHRAAAPLKLSVEVGCRSMRGSCHRRHRAAAPLKHRRRARRARRRPGRHRRHRAAAPLKPRVGRREPGRLAAPSPPPSSGGPVEASTRPGGPARRGCGVTAAIERRPR